MSVRTKIVVAGGGAFGTALAIVFAASDDADVVLLLRDATYAGKVNASRVNERRLPDIKLPDNLIVSADLGHLKQADICLSVVPSSAQIEFARQAQNYLRDDCFYVICAKGFDKDDGSFISNKIAHFISPENIAALSGPGFATDIAQGLPTAMTLACADIGQAERISQNLSRPNFRLYASDDLIGVQAGGALKNVLAIAAGIVMGAKLGDSARASVIARGLAELSRYIVAMGGQTETASGLSGLGDLVLTASSTQSRNYRFGLALGEGQAPQDLMGEGKPLVEGANAALLAAQIGARENIRLPLTNSVAAIIRGELDVKDAVGQLLTRPLKTEKG